MDKQKAGSIFLVIGVVIVFIAGLADVFGYGEGQFGPKQGIGVIFGVIFIIVGWLWRKGSGLALPNLSENDIEVESVESVEK